MFTDTKSLKVMTSRDANFVELSIIADRESDLHSNVTNNMLEYELKSSCNENQLVLDGERNYDEPNLDERLEEISNQSGSEGEQQDEFKSTAESSFDTTLQNEDPEISNESNRRFGRSTHGVSPLRYQEISGAAVR